MNKIRLARPNEISHLKSLGYRQVDISLVPNFLTMELVEPPFEAPFTPDEETLRLVEAVGALGES